MKQVDFYLLSNQVRDAKFKLASKLANKLQRSDLRALIVTDNEESTDRLDQIMWSFNDASYLAHDRLDDELLPSLTHIGPHNSVSQATLERDYDVLINLSTSVPMYNHHFNRIAEIVEADESSKAAGRARYKSYKTEGFELKTHSIEL